MILSAPAQRARLIASGTRTLLTDLSGATRTGAELAARVDRLAGALHAACGPAPRVGLWYRNSLSAVEAFLAVQWLGGTRVPVDPGASADEARAVFAAAGVDATVTDAEHAGLCGATALIHDDDRPLFGDAVEPVNPVDSDAPFMVYPRSVINGNLFGVTLSYGNWEAILNTNIGLYRTGRYGKWDEKSEVFMAAQQIMHGTGFLGTFPFLAMGLPQVVMDQFNAAAFCEAVERYRVTATMFVPSMLDAVVGELSRVSESRTSLRHVLYGGGPITPARIREALDHMGPVLTQVYGRVEGGWPLAILDPLDHLAIAAKPHLASSCGRPVAGVDVQLRPVKAGDGDGELRIRTPMASAAYVDSDGWCSLGDVVREDADGYLYYERRLDRMINTGYHVYPDEVEAVIASCRGVRAVRVQGEPHAQWGQMLVAYVTPECNELAEPLALRVQAHARQRLAKYKVPREVRIVQTLPG